MINFETFASNPYFSAGFGLVGVGAGLAAIRRLSIFGITHLKRRLLVSLEIPSTDKSYHWLLNYLNMHSNYYYFKPNFLAVNTRFEKLQNGTIKTDFDLVPGQGKQYLRWNNRFIEVERQRDTKLMDLSSGAPYETMTLTTLSRDRDVFLKILEESRHRALSKEQGHLIIYTSYGHEWRPFGNPKNKRDLNSVVLKKGQTKRIVNDVQQFLKNEKWYNDRGIPYRRGYLLHGPPGTGKSSFIQALASHLDYNICLLNLSERGLTDDRLVHLLSNTPPRSFVLLEDVDAAMIKRPGQENNHYGGTVTSLTMSGLLNAIDGVAASEERIIFMTTNFIEKLDSALIRPGRVDVKEKLDFVDEYQLIRIFEKFYPNTEKELATKLCSFTKNTKLSPANLQGHFVIYKDDPEKAVNNHESLKQ